ncbi:hypothetical protein ABID21_003985 [Pseudorhizobium tarimense]|uniref:Uncharacterized protein n=1 Tax=Pseudorhizobium tarimense TaxID=1079109 RepID=A0ABV2HBI2_9HYPH
MPDDWNAIAAEVADAIRSVSDISQPNGYPVTLRMPGEALATHRTRSLGSQSTARCTPSRGFRRSEAPPAR